MALAEWLPNALLVAIAILCAANVREGRGQAVACALLVGFDWLEYVMSWTPWSLHFACKAIGLPLSNADIWMLTDAVVAAIVVSIGLDRRWVPLLWSCFAMQIVAHAFYQGGRLEFDTYSRVLDWFFWAQVGCFVWEGGPNVWNRCAHYLDRLRDAVGSRAPAPRRSSSRR